PAEGSSGRQWRPAPPVSHRSWTSCGRFPLGCTRLRDDHGSLLLEGLLPLVGDRRLQLPPPDRAQAGVPPQEGGVVVLGADPLRLLVVVHGVAEAVVG